MQRRKSRESRIRDRQRKEDAGARKDSKVGKHYVFNVFHVFSMEGRKVIGLLKRRVRSQLARWKVACCWGAKRISKSKLQSTHTRARTTFGRRDAERKCTPLWREALLEVKKLKTPRACTAFGRWDVLFMWQEQGIVTSSKASKTWGFWSSFGCNHQGTTLHYATLHSITLQDTTLHSTTPHSTSLYRLNYTTLH